MTSHLSNRWGRADETGHSGRRVIFPLGTIGRGYATAPDVAWSRTWYGLTFAALIGGVLIAWVVGSWYGVGWSALVICAGFLMRYAMAAAVDRRIRHKQGGEPLAWTTSWRLQARDLSPMFLGMQILVFSSIFWMSLLEHNPIFFELSRKLFAILLLLPQLALYIALLMLKLVDEHRNGD